MPADEKAEMKHHQKAQKKREKAQKKRHNSDGNSAGSGDGGATPVPWKDTTGGGSKRSWGR
ncbi:hypothetical protein AAE478_009320 [Parahypoxylon ruwenzoriense]